MGMVGETMHVRKFARKFQAPLDAALSLRRASSAGMRFNQPEFSGNTSLETHLWPASARRQTKLISQVRPPCQQLCISWSWPWLRRVFPGFLPARSLTRQTSARRLTDRGVRVLMFRASFPRSWALSAGRIDAGESGKGNSTPSLSLSLSLRYSVSQV